MGLSFLLKNPNEHIPNSSKGHIAMNELKNKTWTSIIK